MAPAARIPLALAVAMAAAGLCARDSAASGKVWPPPPPYPAKPRLAEAARYASERGGPISFAVVDSAAGLRGSGISRPFSSASASKVLLLAAELRRQRDAPLDAGTRDTLAAMITLSDNGAADAIYARVGDAGLEHVARRAGMRDFAVVPGFWGGDQLTAADLARFYFRLERNLPARHRRYGLRLLAHVAEAQRWGLPAAAGRGWRAYFKGGWRPANWPPDGSGTSGPVTHQAGVLLHRCGQRVAVAILTEQDPYPTGIETVEGVARRLLSRPPSCRPRGWIDV